MSDTGILVSLEDEVAYRSNVVLDYTCRDFTAIRSQLVGLAKGLMPEWQTAGEASDFGTLLLELFSYMGDVMHYYIDRTASEAFLGTALRRQSVLYIADMLGYRPIGQQAASVGLEFRRIAPADPEHPDPAVTLPVGTRVYNETDNADDLVVFELNQEVTLVPGQIIPDPAVLPVQLPIFATEGITVKDSLLGVSKGAPNSEFRIIDKGVVFNTVSIRSNEAGQTLRWAFVTDLSLARPTQAVFTTFLDDHGLHPRRLRGQRCWPHPSRQRRVVRHLPLRSWSHGERPRSRCHRHHRLQHRSRCRSVGHLRPQPRLAARWHRSRDGRRHAPVDPQGGCSHQEPCGHAQRLRRPRHAGPRCRQERGPRHRVHRRPCPHRSPGGPGRRHLHAAA